MAEGTFVTALNCMDGRVQQPVWRWLQDHYGADYVDMVTEAGPNKVLFDGDEKQIKALKSKIEVSLYNHGSMVIAIAGHEDCAGNPVSKDVKWEQTKENVTRLQEWYPDVSVIGLWISLDEHVEKVI